MLRVTRLSKSFTSSDREAVRVFENISFEVPQGTFFTLLGPSGCGKTTTLRSIAGLERPDSGSITINSNLVFDGSSGLFTPPNKRNVGMVFQSYAIWPHMNVFENVAFPLRVGTSRLAESEVKHAVETALATVHLERYRDRSATQLSGGQQQRLALARAIVTKPDLLLLDEPLSNLDAKLRESMRLELRRLQRDVGITTIYVTHDQAEALALSDIVAVMNEGAIVQIGDPKQIYYEPHSRFVANFIGFTNLISCTSREEFSDSRALATTASGPLKCVYAGDARTASDIVLSIRPERVRLGLPGNTRALPETFNVTSGRITEKVFLGEVTEFIVHVGSDEWRVRSAENEDYPVGTDVEVVVKAEDCLAIKQ
jgi:iron(III) transport system ATP-binding protein